MSLKIVMTDLGYFIVEHKNGFIVFKNPAFLAQAIVLGEQEQEKEETFETAIQSLDGSPIDWRHLWKSFLPQVGIK